MCKKINKIILFLLVFSFLGNVAKAFGPACPPIPFCPMPDFINESGSILQSVASLSNNAQKTITSTSDAANNLRAAVQSVFSGELSTLIDNSENSSGQRAIVNCVYDNQEYKNDDAEDVHSLITHLFLQYPSKDEIAMRAYRENRKKFYYDSVIEINTALRELKAEMDITNQQIDETIACITTDGSKCGVGKAEANTDALFIEGKAYEAIENLYTMLLKITALKAQFVAVKSINDLEPADYVEGISEQVEGPMGEGEEETSSSDKQAFIMESSFSRGDIISFAQIGLSSSDSMVTTSLSQVEAATVVSADKGQRMIGSVMFNLTTKPEQQHAYVDAEEKMAELENLEPLTNKVNTAKEVHNLINSLPSYKNAAQGVEDAKKDYEKAVEDLRISDACARAYIGRHFSNPDEVWSGGSQNLTNYDDRGGISGWAIQAYSAAKAVQANDIEDEEIETIDIDYENDITETEEWNVDRDRDLLDKKTKGLNNKSKEEKMGEEQRQANMLSWQIGAEASKMLSATPHQWGKVISANAFPIWQDVKGFYNQYLNKKYSNIKSYLKSFSNIDVLSVVADKLSGNTGELNSESTDIINTELNNSLLKVDEALRQTLDKQNSEYKTSLGIIEQKRIALAKKLENLGNELKANVDNLSDMREQSQAKAGEDMIAEVTHIDDFPASINDEIPESRPLPKVKELGELKTQFKGQTILTKDNSEFKSLESIVNRQKQEIIDLEKELSIVDEELASYQDIMQSGDSDVYEQTKELKLDLQDKAAELMIKSNQEREKNIKSVLLPLLEQKIEEDPTLTITAEKAYKNMLSAAEKALSGLYDQVDARVDAAYNQIMALDDEIYNSINHSKIVEIHQGMIDDIKAMSITVDAGLLPAVSGIELYAKLLTADSSPELEDYFVGNPAKGRDIKAPKAIFEQNLPPVREIFHFDNSDFQQVKAFSAKKKKTSTILKEDFLNMGGDIPLVWRYMLRQPAFVETDIDLATILDNGCPQLAFFRHGNMPCKVRDSNVILDMNDKGEFVKVTDTSLVINAAAPCPQLVMRKNKIKHVSRNVNIDTKMFDNSDGKECVYSELGTLFAADEKNNIYFRQPIFDAYFAIWYENSDDNKKVSDKENQELAAVELAPYSRNQIGDFLVYAEGEQSMRKQQEEVQANYAGMLQRLTNILSEYGYEISENLNMAKDNDYELVRKELKNIKHKLIAEAIEMSKGIKIENNSVVEERLRALESIIEAIQKDVDEQVVVGDGVDEENDLDERIKTAKVNREASSKYENSISQSEDASGADSPYCALY